MARSSARQSLALWLSARNFRAVPCTRTEIQTETPAPLGLNPKPYVTSMRRKPALCYQGLSRATKGSGLTR